MLGKRAGGTVLDTKRAVSDMLRHVGQESWGYGNYIHALQGFIAEHLPIELGLIQNYSLKGLKKAHAR
jgi:hypothetical protein